MNKVERERPREASPVAGDESRPPLVEWIQPKLPDPVEAVGLAAEHQRALGFDGGDGKTVHPGRSE